MIKQQIKYIILTVFILILVFTNIIIFFSITEKKNLTNSLQEEINLLSKRLERSIKTKKESEINKYFFEKTEDFEKYIREILRKSKSEVKYYKISISEKDYIELNIKIVISSINFFEMLKEIEKSDKLILVNNLQTKKLIDPNIEVAVNLKGYYKK
ncbi:MAG: hypothetical protein A2086_15615 [Spirochaetes bacterium GWD1_27_9]|nr:MAG: hypothetical protein A2Z98_14225 [Spirochaetes bacterium GWB1_27_13]OHD22491.1 MAG: hypothetical protein A2Y34_06730 [Spirochaetes bacterium GWC1_27_15]OHD42809.1 MAG: hypothetical protein A2086_15615 [Spirochaetes bacterium GWD1_27_9]